MWRSPSRCTWRLSARPRPTVRTWPPSGGRSCARRSGGRTPRSCGSCRPPSVPVAPRNGPTVSKCPMSSTNWPRWRSTDTASPWPVGSNTSCGTSPAPARCREADPMTDQTEAAPKVPPPAESTRKPTAKEVADRALEGVLGLQAKLDELEARGVVPAPSGESTPVGLAELDRDLSALTDFVNDLAGKVGTASGSTPVADPRTEETLQAIGQDLQGL